MSGRIPKLAAAAALMLSMVGVADAEAQRPMRFGIIGGANITGAWGDDADDTDTQTGFDVGGLAQIPVGEMVTIQPEVHYTQKGFSRGLVTGEEERSLDYIQVPVLLRAGVPLAEGFDVDLQFGPSFGFLMSCESRTETAGTTTTIDCDDSTRGFDWGIIGGGSFSWAAGPGDFLFDIRYDLGMTEVGDAEGAPDIRNTSFQFLLGYAFPM